jgi:hypothetical protein
MTSRGFGVLLALTAAFICLFATLPPAAPAEHTLRASFPGTKDGASADGRRVFFSTSAQLVPEDIDQFPDIYERFQGTTTLITTSTVPPGNEGTEGPHGVGVSKDGLHYFFATDERMAPEDVDSYWDIYEHFNGVTRLVTPTTVGGNPSFAGTCDPYEITNEGCQTRVSDDGSRFFFTTRESLVPEDPTSDSCRYLIDQEPTYGQAPCLDVYMYAGGVTTLVSKGTTGGSGPYDAYLSDVSADGSRAFFFTDESLVSSDGDCTTASPPGCQDIYEYVTDGVNGTTTLASTGPGDARTEYALFGDVSRDGTQLFFSTGEKLAATDVDSSFDGYVRGPGGIEHLTIGPTGGNGAFGAVISAASDAGERVFFTTREALTSEDVDGASDIYERSAGTTKLVSTPPVMGPNYLSPPTFRGMSSDGTHVFFTTSEALDSNDGDGVTDIYERYAGTTRLVATGPLDGANVKFVPDLAAISQDGERVFFNTAARLVSADNDNECVDGYERSHGTTTTLLTPGPPSFSCTANTRPRNRVLRTSENGLRAFIDADDVLLPNQPGPTYLAIIDVPYPRPGSGSPQQVPLVPAYAPCTSSNTQHAPPLDVPACAPPAQISSMLTTSTIGRGSGVAIIRAIAGNPGTTEDEADIHVTVSATDVVCRSQTADCAGAGSDFTGRLLFSVRVRLTDRANEYEGTSGTVVDTALEAPVDCVATPSAAGSRCSVTTGMEALIPGLVSEGKNSIFDLQSVELRDPGPNGTGYGAGCPTACGDGDEKTYMIQGLFTP